VLDRRSTLITACALMRPASTVVSRPMSRPKCSRGPSTTPGPLVLRLLAHKRLQLLPMSTAGPKIAKVSRKNTAHLLDLGLAERFARRRFERGLQLGVHLIQLFDRPVGVGYQAQSFFSG